MPPRKRRYKGLCERQAKERGLKTARLPIARYVHLNSRAVLTVNHVSRAVVLGTHDVSRAR